MNIQMNWEASVEFQVITSLDMSLALHTLRMLIGVMRRSLSYTAYLLFCSTQTPQLET